MEAADILCESLFRWLENRKKCAEELKKLAQELEDVHQGSNIGQVVGAATSVASISGALIATVLTGGLAGPVLVAAAVGTVAGTAVSVTSTLVETFISSSTFKKANELMKEDEKVGTKIQEQLRDLKDRCRGALNADELDCEVTTRLMWSLARRSNTPVPLDFLRGFNRATFFHHLAPGGLDPDQASRFICQALGAATVFSLMTSSLKVSGKVMMKNIGRIGIKSAVKAGSRVLGVIGLGISLYDLIDKSVELAKDNQVTEASKFLRDSARQILDGQQELKEQLDAMHEIIQELLKIKNLIKNLGGYSLNMTEEAQKIINYIKITCPDNTVSSWLQTHEIAFVNLLRFFLEKLGHILEDLTKPYRGHIHIVIVAHGGIVDEFMPAGGLVPTPNITDTVLYSPWNCAIDANAAFGIAQGSIQATDRVFVNMARCEPNPLPNRWNSMRESPSDIPVILLSPVTEEDGAWKYFNQYRIGMEIEDRVIIPYLVPEKLKKEFGQIPLFIFIFAISFLLMMYNKTATVHLAACLSRGGSPERRVEWRRQYAYTSDGAYMTVNIENKYMHNDLYRAFRSLFDRKRR
ncbi:uncharacterized protein LOC120465351 [Pimephales promelas]|uniref:uncharacterized protein LOC120465351 n=1 Tax=Pimephales promelas TaxID=90988 RepID=UPI0019554BCF|nr:uncharacterized protein LOC120465351 [Pimephales promelas]